jgi:MFS family permease
LSNFNKTNFSRKENLYLSAIFFYFGITIMSLAPRTPDLKANLAINNGTFGTLLSTASIGSLIMLLIGGQIVHVIGAKLALRIGMSIIALAFITLCHTHSPVVFLIANITAGVGISTYHIGSSGHTLHRQDEVGKNIISRLHGAWGVGAVTTALLGFILSDHVSIAWHITVLMIIVWLFTQYTVTKLSPTFPPKTADDNYQLTSIKQFKFKINWILFFGFFCGTITEFISADWATLFGKEELGMGASLATLSYLFFILGLTIGRFAISWALKFQSERFWLRTGGLVGGGSFVLLMITSTYLVNINQSIAHTMALISFFLAGLGSAATSPIFYSIAGRLSNGNNSVAVAQLTFTNTLAIFIAKTILSWMVELTSITVALTISGLALMALFYFGKIGSNERVQRK